MLEFAYPQFNNILVKNKSEQYKISYLAMGNPASDKVLFCVHGLNRNNRDWDFIATMAANNGYYVICPDVVGRGNSDYLQDYTNYTIPNYIADLIQLMDSLGLKGVNYIGTSLGGLIGMGIAAVRPDLINALILNDIGAKIEISGIQRIAAYSADKQEFATLQEAKDRLIATSREFGYDMSSELWDYIALNSYAKNNQGNWTLRRDPKIALALASAYSDASSLEDFSLWQKVHVPTLIIRGQDSDILSLETIERMKSTMPGLKYIEYPNCAHAPFLYSKEHFSDIQNFFDSLE